MTEKEEKELLKLVRANNRLLTTVAKALHLVPVTEKEEQELQIMRRKNEEQASKVNSQLNAMQNIPDEYTENALGNLFSNVADIYGDVLTDEFIGSNTSVEEGDEE